MHQFPSKNEEKFALDAINIIAKYINSFNPKGIDPINNAYAFKGISHYSNLSPDMLLKSMNIRLEDQLAERTTSPSMQRAIIYLIERLDQKGISECSDKIYESRLTGSIFVCNGEEVLFGSVNKKQKVQKADFSFGFNN